jgi:hypothetical protein
MVWACSAAIAVHVAAALVLGWPAASGEGAANSQHAMTVRYLPDEHSSLQAATQAELVAGPQNAGEAVAAASGASQAAGAAQGGTPRRYFAVSEVDEPAVPKPDWTLDPSVLLRNGVRSMKVEVLVSETGRAERCTVLSMDPPTRRLYGTIESQICATRLTAAVLNGVAVPSVRHVEILLSDE